MKKELITCDIIQDLLPLYEDECCSKDSRNMVEKHLNECEICRKKSRLFERNVPAIDDETDLAEAEAIKKGAGKIKRIRTIGFVALVLAILLICIVVPLQIRRSGAHLAFEGSTELNIAKEFLHALEDRDYETAYTYFDIEGSYDALTKEMTEGVSEEGFKQITENGFVWYDKVCKEAFVRNMILAESMNEMVASFNGYNIQKTDDIWAIEFEAKTTSGENIVIQFVVNKNGISSFSHDINSTIDYNVFGNPIVDKEMEAKSKELDRYYLMPTYNEEVIGLLYEGTDYEWQKLFE